MNLVAKALYKWIIIIIMIIRLRRLRCPVEKRDALNETHLSAKGCMESRPQGNKMAAARKGKKRPEVRKRKWTDIELKQFAIGLADNKSEFGLTLDTLALKKSANIHIFEQVKKELDARLLE